MGKYQKDLNELNKVNSLRRLASLMGGAGGILIVIGCLIFLAFCLLSRG